MNADESYLIADAADRRSALSAAVAMTSHRGDIGFHPDADPHWLHLADQAYRWLRRRPSLRAVTLRLLPGTPFKEGTTPMTTTFTLDDTDAVTFSLTGEDAKGATVPLADGFTAAWSLADPDASGAVLAVSDDTTTATVSAGVPDTNLMLSVVVTNPDSSTLSGAEAIVVQATAATTVSLVPGTEVPE